MSIFDKWNENIDGKKLAEEVKEVEANGGLEYPEIPCGKYDVSIKKMELKESSKHDPMLAIQFKILEGEYKGNCIFMNQVLKLSFQIGLANEFLRSLGTDVCVEFNGDFNAYNEILLAIEEEIEEQRFEFMLRYGKNDKGYNTFKIEEVYSD